MEHLLLIDVYRFKKVQRTRARGSDLEKVTEGMKRAL